MLFGPPAFRASSSRLGPDLASHLFAKGLVWQTVAYGSTFRKVGSSDFLEEPVQYSSAIEGAFAKANTPWTMLSNKWKHLISYEEDFASVARQVLTVLGMYKEYTVFATEIRYIGKADGETICEGDVLCILFGCSLPAILRPAGETYQLLTFAWVHDLM